jgi:hypothetical protein
VPEGRGLFEIRRIGGKYLRAGGVPAERLNGSHAGELPAQALVVLAGGGEPDAVVGVPLALSCKLKTIFSPTYTTATGRPSPISPAVPIFKLA